MTEGNIIGLLIAGIVIFGWLAITSRMEDIR